MIVRYINVHLIIIIIIIVTLLGHKPFVIFCFGYPPWPRSKTIDGICAFIILFSAILIRRELVNDCVMINGSDTDIAPDDSNNTIRYDTIGLR